MSRRDNTVSFKSIAFIYIASLLMYIICSFFPNLRVWGFSIYAHFPIYIPIIISVIGLIALMILWKQSGRFAWASPHLPPTNAEGTYQAQNQNISSKTYWIIAGLTTIIFGILFYLFKAKTFFLGDGYQALSLLATGNPIIKNTEPGEIYSHLFVKSFFLKNAALLSFQIISIFTGLIFIVSTFIFSNKIFEQTKDKLLFTFGILSGGYMLLSFGYVEYYSIFVLSVTIYAYFGMLVALGKISKWWIIPFALLPSLFHIFGVTLLPSAIYLFFATTPFGEKVKAIQFKNKMLFGFLFILLSGLVFYYFYKNNIFFNYSIVRLEYDNFALDGYSMISIPHIVDYINLLFLLLPGVGLLLFTLFNTRIKSLIKKREYFFLIIFVLSVMGAVFIFDPKLGMPRDWDLFCYAGIPLSIFFYYKLINNKKKYSIIIITLSTLLGFISLTGRVGTLYNEEIGKEQFIDYMQLDKKKNFNSNIILMNYYKQKGDSLKSQEILKNWIKESPEKYYLNIAYKIMRNKNYKEAIKYLYLVVKSNPGIYSAWSDLGSCYLEIGQFNEAIKNFKIALGINPYGSTQYNNMAICYFKINKFKDAEEYLLRAESLPNPSAQIYNNLYYVYKHTHEKEKSIKYLIKASEHKDASASILQELGSYYLSSNQFDKAKKIYSRALKLGIDSNYVDSLKQIYPALK
ncbi:MAG: hypothetical protein U9N54_06045 [candidate division Zixibacteria bacterium]|nr:hypothetical protein [candidate division Zixibacteria bacterium]